jgi:hypothetical protein
MKSILTLVVAALCGIALAAGNTEQAANSGSTKIAAQPQNAPVVQADAISIPQLINYQGKLTDGSGNPITETRDMAFALYAESTGGTAVWTETQTGINVVSGLFNVLLGAVTPVSAIPNGPSLFLEITVAGTVIAPRARLASVPYAAKADDAAKLQGRAVSDAAPASGQVIKWNGSAWVPDQDLTGGGSGVVNVYQATGVVCTPNPITSSGTVGFDATWGDARYVNEAQANSITSSMIVDRTIRGVDIAVPCTLSGSGGTSYALLHVLPANDGGIVVRRTSTGTTNYALHGQTTSGSGGGIGGEATGNDGASVGVRGRTTAAYPGVHGVSSASYVAAPAVAAGVCGYSATGPAFYAATSGTYGLSLGKFASTAVDVDSSGSYGMYVTTCASNGYRIQNTTTAGWGGFYAGYTSGEGFRSYQPATHGLTVGGAGYDGVLVSQADSNGIEVTNAGLIGVYANSNSRRGGYFRNNNNSYYALTAWNNTGTGGTVRGLYVQGAGYATGGWQTFLNDGRPGFAPISPEQEVIFSGSSRLTDGSVQVSFDQGVASALSAEIPLRVVVTPTTECNGLCVVNKGAQGFTVKEVLSGKSAASFDWIVIGRKKGYEQRPDVQPIRVEDRPSDAPSTSPQDNPPRED